MQPLLQPPGPRPFSRPVGWVPSHRGPRLRTAMAGGLWGQQPKAPSAGNSRLPSLRGNRDSGHGVGALSLGRGPPSSTPAPATTVDGCHAGPSPVAGWRGPQRFTDRGSHSGPHVPWPPYNHSLHPGHFLQPFIQQTCHHHLASASWSHPGLVCHHEHALQRHPAGPGREDRWGRGAPTRGTGFSGREEVLQALGSSLHLHPTPRCP